MKITRNHILAILAGAVVIAGLAATAAPARVAVETGKVDKGPLSVIVGGDGVASVRVRHIVTSPVTGYLQRISLRTGDRVGTGDTLARISSTVPTPLDARTRAEAIARASAAGASEAESRSFMDNVKLTSDRAKRELERAKSLFASGAITKQALDSAQFEADTAARNVEVATYGVDTARQSAEAARVVLKQFASGRPSPGSSVLVPSPAPGIVLRVLDEQEGSINAGTPLIEVGDPSELEAVTDLLTTEAVRIKPGMPAKLTRWGGTADLEGVVEKVDPSAFTKVSALGVEEQRINVVVIPAKRSAPWSALSDGYRVDTRITVWHGEDVIRVPIPALFRRSSGWFVFTVENGRARERAVNIGERGEKAAQVVSGLSPGESIVMYPSDKVRDGVRVKIRSGDGD